MFFGNFRKNESLWLGRFEPMLLIEIGDNHVGDFYYAKKIVDLGIDTNVDFKKL